MERLSSGRAKRIAQNTIRTVCILALATVLCEILYELEIGEQNIIIVMVLAVFMIAAFTDGFVYGLVATLAGSLIYDYLVTAPRLGFSITEGYPVTLSIMVLVTLVTSTITTGIKRRMQTAREHERHAELLYEINREFLSVREAGTVLRRAVRYLKENLRLSAAVWSLLQQGEEHPLFTLEEERDQTAEDFLGTAERAARLSAAEGQKPVFGPKAFYLPIVSHGHIYGVFGVSCAKRALSQEERMFAELITEQAAQALQVGEALARQQEAQIAAETEKARNSLLRGISHDLRTPLTSMVGASATLLENSAELTEETRLRLTAGILEDAQWLRSMVDNILSITRLQSRNMQIEKQEEVAEEVLSGAVAAFRKRYPEVDISILSCPEVLVVPMDPILVTQVLTNLLDNARRHGGERAIHITVGLSKRGETAVFSVSDNGVGIDAEALRHLFGVRPDQGSYGEDASRGLGMGLSICKTIIEAHGGTISAENRPSGGAHFEFMLPLVEHHGRNTEDDQ